MLLPLVLHRRSHLKYRKHARLSITKATYRSVLYRLEVMSHPSLKQGFTQRCYSYTEMDDSFGKKKRSENVIQPPSSYQLLLLA